MWIMEGNATQQHTNTLPWYTPTVSLLILLQFIISLLFTCDIFQAVVLNRGPDNAANSVQFLLLAGSLTQICARTHALTSLWKTREVKIGNGGGGCKGQLGSLQCHAKWNDKHNTFHTVMECLESECRLRLRWPACQGETSEGREFDLISQTWPDAHSLHEMYVHVSFRATKWLHASSCRTYMCIQL